MSGDRLSGSLGLLVAIAVIIYSLKLRVGVIGAGQLGPGTFPLICGVCLGFCSAMLLAQSFRSTSGGKAVEDQEKKGNFRLLVYPFGALIIYGLIFEWLGFILSTFLLVIFLFRLLESKKWGEVLFTAGAISVAVYVVFGVLLKSSLPNGLLDAFLR